MINDCWVLCYGRLLTLHNTYLIFQYYFHFKDKFFFENIKLLKFLLLLIVDQFYNCLWFIWGYPTTKILSIIRTRNNQTIYIFFLMTSKSSLFNLFYQLTNTFCLWFAGGRNMTISLQSRTGHTNMGAVVGMLVFCQFWFWYPLAHFLNMAFTPTSVIGLNADLKVSCCIIFLAL